MARSSKEDPANPPVADDLDPYRRLVELQKQMIELARQHEQAKRVRDALHEQIVREATNRRPRPWDWHQRLQQSAARILKRLPGFAGEKPEPHRFNRKPVSSH